MNSSPVPSSRTYPLATGRLGGDAPLDDRLGPVAALTLTPPLVAPQPPPGPSAVTELYRHADEAPVLGPGAVVVLDVGLVEQLVQHEPGVRRPLADRQ